MSRRRRRWHRIAIPFATAVALIAGTVVAHSVDEPDFADAGTLSPLGTGPDGSSRLAALLAGRGVPVERQTSSLDTVREAMRAEATVFIPAPGLVNANLVRLLAALPIAHRIVLVEPGRRDQFALPVANLGTRWASLAVPPGCDNAWARAAGRASALRTRYDAGSNGSICYGGGLVGARLGRAELFVVGASDLFRNGRIGEHGNARLATDLLAGKPRVLWLDRHAKERVTYSTVTGERLGVRLPDGGQDGNSGDGGNTGSKPSPLWTAVPPMLWPLLVQLLLVAAVLALWRARRLGPPVPEPLPVAVPAAETVTGRGRLYERADARGAALGALQAAARHRILPLLDLPPDAAERDVAAAVTARTGQAPGEVRTVLYGFEPADDDDLLSAVAALDALVAAVSRERTRV